MLATARAIQPDSLDCGSGQLTYSGTVYNSNSPSTTQDGVVVVVVTEPNQSPWARGTATTASDGTWSVTLNSLCAVDAYFYWQSSSNGPLTKKVLNFQPFISTSTTVPVWSQLVSIPLLYEFPNPTGSTSYTSTVSWSLTTTLDFAFDASISGGIQTGFWGVDASGKVGTDVNVGQGYQQSGTLPWYAYKPVGAVFKVQDTYGNSMVYLNTYTGSQVQSTSTSDYLTMTDGINRDHAAAIYPYVQVAPGILGQGGSTSISQSVTLDGSVSITALGVTLTLHVSATTGTTQTVSYSLSNASTSNQCFAYYALGGEIHLWYYGQGSCPSS